MYDLIDLIIEGIIVVGVAYVVFKLDELSRKPPVLIQCSCFNDIQHDEMVQVKEMYCRMKQEALAAKEKEEGVEEKEEDGEKIEKED